MYIFGCKKSALHATNSSGPNLNICTTSRVCFTSLSRFFFFSFQPPAVRFLYLNKILHTNGGIRFALANLLTYVHMHTALVARQKKSLSYDNTLLEVFNLLLPNVMTKFEIRISQFGRNHFETHLDISRWLMRFIKKRFWEKRVSLILLTEESWL